MSYRPPFEPDFDLVLVGCGRNKDQKTQQARTLYTGALFRQSRLWAEKFGRKWAILSAQHGLLWPTQTVQPYDRSLQGESRSWRAYWGRATADAIARSCGPKHHGQNPLRSWEGRHVCLLAGALYSDAVGRHLVGVGLTVTEPLRGLFVGQRLQWLRQQLEVQA